MIRGLESLSSREYPGRVVVIGQDSSGVSTVIIYAISGRSPSSQARKLTVEGNAIWVQPTDEETLGKGNRELLVYPAIQFTPQGIAVSNGKQTSDISMALVQSQNPVEVLSASLSTWDYEPDSPIFTPRISGCVLADRKAALGIIRRASDGTSQRKFYDVPLIPGHGKMIATYSGKNEDPLPSFTEEPVEVGIQARRADEMAEAVYDALGPEAGKDDLRVSVACVFTSDFDTRQEEIYIINRHERIRS
jgi:IMP cyclohydrolase